MNELEFKASKKITPLAIVLMFVSTIIIGLAVSVLGTWLDYLISDVYIEIVIAALTGVIIGFSLSFIAKQLKVRSKVILLLVVALAMAIVAYLRLNFMMATFVSEGALFSETYIEFLKITIFDFSLFYDLLVSLSEMITFNGSTVGSLFLYLWGIESAAIVLIAAFMSTSKTKQPFDEERNEWLEATTFNVTLEPFNKMSRTHILEAIERHDVQFFRNLMTHPKENRRHHSKIYFYKNSEGNNSGIIEIKTTYANGNNNSNYVVLSPHNVGATFANDLEREFRDFEISLSNEIVKSVETKPEAKDHSIED